MSKNSNFRLRYADKGAKAFSHVFNRVMVSFLWFSEAGLNFVQDNRNKT